MLNTLKSLAININPVVRITRNLNLEKSILRIPGEIIVRRYTCDIPFGYRGRHRQPNRGRKRTTNNFMVRSIQPNVDGRSLTTAQALAQSPPPPPAAASSRAPSIQSTTPTPPNFPIKKNTAPTKSTTITTITYARPSQLVTRRLTFSSFASSHSPPSSSSSPQQSSGSIDLSASAQNTTIPQPSVDQVPPDFGQM